MVCRCRQCTSLYGMYHTYMGRLLPPTYSYMRGEGARSWHGLDCHSSRSVPVRTVLYGSPRLDYFLYLHATQGRQRNAWCAGPAPPLSNERTSQAQGFLFRWATFALLHACIILYHTVQPYSIGVPVVPTLQRPAHQSPSLNESFVAN
jgi:hypothetical protein